MIGSSKLRHVNAAVVLMAFGLAALVSNYAYGDPPNCDNQCRERNHIYVCGGVQNPCWDFYRATCLNCTAPANARCVVLTTDSGGSCSYKDSTNRVVRGSDCSSYCDCGEAAYVESLSIITPNSMDGDADDTYKCGSKVVYPWQGP